MSPFLVAVYDPEAGGLLAYYLVELALGLSQSCALISLEFQSLCRVMSGFSDQQYEVFSSDGNVGHALFFGEI